MPTEPTLTLTLPAPPSLNSLWRVVNGRPMLSKPYRLWRARALHVIRGVPGVEPFEGSVRLDIVLRRRTRARFDLDNVPKAVCDALEHGGVLFDDADVDRLTVSRGETVTRAECLPGFPAGLVVVSVGLLS